MNLPQEPLGIRRRGSSPLFRYSCRHSLLSRIHGWITPPLHPRDDAPLPIRTLGPVLHPTQAGLCPNPAASVTCLSPVTFSAPNYSTSELLRTLSRMAASKPTSWLSEQMDIVSHLAKLRDLSWRSGLFPSRLRTLSLAVSLPRLAHRYSEFA